LITWVSTRNDSNFFQKQMEVLARTEKDRYFLAVVVKAFNTGVVAPINSSEVDSVLAAERLKGIHVVSIVSFSTNAEFRHTTSEHKMVTPRILEYTDETPVELNGNEFWTDKERNVIFSVKTQFKNWFYGAQTSAAPSTDANAEWILQHSRISMTNPIHMNLLRTIAVNLAGTHNNVPDWRSLGFQGKFINNAFNDLAPPSGLSFLEWLHCFSSEDPKLLQDIIAKLREQNIVPIPFLIAAFNKQLVLWVLRDEYESKEKFYLGVVKEVVKPVPSPKENLYRFRSLETRSKITNWQRKWTKIWLLLGCVTVTAMVYMLVKGKLDGTDAKLEVTHPNA